MLNVYNLWSWSTMKINQNLESNLICPLHHPLKIEPRERLNFDLLINPTSKSFGHKSKPLSFIVIWRWRGKWLPILYIHKPITNRNSNVTYPRIVQFLEIWLLIELIPMPFLTILQQKLLFYSGMPYLIIYLFNISRAAFLSTYWAKVHSSMTIQSGWPILASKNMDGVIHGSRTSQPPIFTPLILPSPQLRPRVCDLKDW